MNQKDKIREIISKLVYEELCARGKAYRKARMAAGEKSSAYLSGRAVKVCKGQIKGAGGKKKKSYRGKENKHNIMKTTELRNLIKETIKEISEDAAMKKSALGMAMYGKKSKMERARYKDGGPPIQEQAGEVNVFGYQTQHFDICPGAQSLYKAMRS